MGALNCVRIAVPTSMLSMQETCAMITTVCMASSVSEADEAPKSEAKRRALSSDGRAFNPDLSWGELVLDSEYHSSDSGCDRSSSQASPLLLTCKPLSQRSSNRGDIAAFALYDDGFLGGTEDAYAFPTDEQSTDEESQDDGFEENCDPEAQERLYSEYREARWRQVEYELQEAEALERALQQTHEQYLSDARARQILLELDDEDNLEQDLSRTHEEAANIAYSSKFWKNFKAAASVELKQIQVASLGLLLAAWTGIQMKEAGIQ